MVDVASKQQTTALFLSTIVTRTRRHTEMTTKLTNLMGNLCCAGEHSVQFLHIIHVIVSTAFTVRVIFLTLIFAGHTVLKNTVCQ